MSNGLDTQPGNQHGRNLIIFNITRKSYVPGSKSWWTNSKQKKRRRQQIITKREQQSFARIQDRNGQEKDNRANPYIKSFNTILLLEHLSRHSDIFSSRYSDAFSSRQCVFFSRRHRAFSSRRYCGLFSRRHHVLLEKTPRFHLEKTPRFFLEKIMCSFPREDIVFSSQEDIVLSFREDNVFSPREHNNKATRTWCHCKHLTSTLAYLDVTSWHHYNTTWKRCHLNASCNCKATNSLGCSVVACDVIVTLHALGCSIVVST